MLQSIYWRPIFHSSHQTVSAGLYFIFLAQTCITPRARLSFWVKSKFIHIIHSLQSIKAIALPFAWFAPCGGAVLHGDGGFLLVEKSWCGLFLKVKWSCDCGFLEIVISRVGKFCLMCFTLVECSVFSFCCTHREPMEVSVIEGVCAVLKSPLWPSLTSSQGSKRGGDRDLEIALDLCPCSFSFLQCWSSLKQSCAE